MNAKGLSHSKTPSLFRGVDITDLSVRGMQCAWQRDIIPQQGRPTTCLFRLSVCLSVCLKPKLVRVKTLKPLYVCFLLVAAKTVILCVYNLLMCATVYCILAVCTAAVIPVGFKLTYEPTAALPTSH